VHNSIRGRELLLPVFFVSVEFFLHEKPDRIPLLRVSPEFLRAWAGLALHPVRQGMALHPVSATALGVGGAHAVSFDWGANGVILGDGPHSGPYRTRFLGEGDCDATDVTDAVGLSG